MEDLLEFVESLTDWHSERVKNLENVITQVKAGVKLQSADREDLVELNEEQAKYFKAGLQLALGEFETLPFKVLKPEGDEGDIDE